MKDEIKAGDYVKFKDSCQVHHWYHTMPMVVLDEPVVFNDYISEEDVMTMELKSGYKFPYYKKHLEIDMTETRKRKIQGVVDNPDPS
jgi:hypothetical protein